MSDQPNKEKKVVSFIKKLFKALIIIVSGLVIFSLLLYVIVNIFITPIVKKKIIESVYQSSGGLYLLEFDKFNVMLLEGNANIGNVHIFQDTAVLRKIRLENPRGNYSDVEVRAENITVKNVKWVTYIFDRALKVDGIEIQDPRFSFKGNIPVDTIEIAHQSFLDVVPGLVASFAGSLNINELKINRGVLAVDLKGKSGTTKQNADSIFLEMRNIRIDTGASRNVLFTTQVKFNIGNYKLVSSDSLFEISVKQFLGSYEDSLLGMHDVKVTPLKRSDKEKYNAKIKFIRAYEVDFSLFFKENKIAIGQLFFQTPDVDFVTTITANDSSVSVGDMLAKFLPYISNSLIIKTFALKEGKVSLKVFSPKGLVEQAAEDILLLAKDIAVSSGSIKASNYWGEISLGIKNYMSKVLPQNIELKVRNLEAFTGEGKIYLSGFSLAQMHETEETFIMFNNTIEKIEGESVNFHRLISGTGLEMQLLSVSGMLLKIYDNENFKNSYEGKGRMPNELLKELGFYLNIKEFDLINCDIIYEQFDDIQNRRGKLTFNDTHLKIKNLSNLTGENGDTSSSVFMIQSKIMDQGKLDVVIRYPLYRKSFDYTLKGTLSPIDGTKFNGIMQFSGLELRSGTFALPSLNMEVLSGSAKGTFALEFQDLRINLIRDSGKKRRLKSRIANLAIKNNGRKIEPLSYKRHKTDGFISFVWNAVSGGVEKAIIKDIFHPFIKNEK
ncbi:hypothetical protein [Sporocytophaga myxococcoides]|uniref:hypothetical protein n=1 Tax=Sporocytophaga myxococcoides TaxID=153721 RepID=UPI0004145086|nr:hypothetical protein [Sporocytophaga myxococcoides]